MLRNEKDAVIAEVQQLLTDTENMFVSDYRGLTVEELAELRGKLRQSGASFKIVKNTLGGIAADRAGRETVKELLAGPTAVTFCGEDLVGAAKALSDFAKTHPQLEVRGGLLDASLIDPDGVKVAGQPPAARRAHRAGGRHHGRTDDGSGHRPSGHDQRFRPCPRSGGAAARRRRRGVSRSRTHPVQQGFQAPREVN